jgi:hypothetical protein
MRGRRSNRKVLYVLVFIILFAVIISLFLVPTGSYVYTVVYVGENSIAISQCVLRKGYLLNILNPDENISKGDRTLILEVYQNQTKLLSVMRNDIGMGSCVLQSEMLPSNIASGSELSISIRLLNSANETIATTQSTLIY